MATWDEEETLLLAALDDDTRAVLLDWRERRRPAKARWRAALRAERLGPYRPPGYVEEPGAVSPQVARAIRALVRGEMPTPTAIRRMPWLHAPARSTGPLGPLGGA